MYRGDRFDPNFYHRAGVDIDHAFLLGKRLFVPKMNEAMARARFKGTVMAYEDAVKSLRPHLGGEVGFDALSLNAGLHMKLARVCRMKDCSGKLLAARARKKPGEVAAIRHAAKCTKRILASLDLEKAKTELGLRKQLLVATAELGLEPAFPPIVAAGTNSAYPHHEPTGKRLGSLVLVDYGVKYRHYRSDLTRCFVRDAAKKREYEALEDVCHSIIDAMPGLETGKDVSRLAAKLMKRAGFPKMIHSIGHGIGLDVHELPSLGRKSADRIAGTTMAVEPAFYKRQYGMRFEETVYFDGKKARIL